MKFSLSKKTKNLMVIILTIVALAILFTYFFNNSKVPELTSSSGLQSKDLETLNSGIGDKIKNETSYLSTLLSLNKITIDPSLFSSISFKSLKDNSVEIISDGVVGRLNPFIPFDKQVAEQEVNDLVDLTQVNSTEKK